MAANRKVAEARAASSWDALGLQLKDAECPIAIALDAAADAVVLAAEANLLEEETAARRLALIAVRRTAIASAQASFGCPRQKNLEETSANEEYVCKLPAGLVESVAFGELTNNMGIQPAMTGPEVGFKANQD